MSETPVWERQPTETHLAYNAFALYREMGALRSLEKVRQKLGKDSEGYLRQLEKWSALYAWVARAQAWDAHQQALLDARVAEQKARLIDDELTDYKAQLEKWRKVFGITNAQEATSTDWLTLSKWRSSIADLGRRALGMPDQIQQQQHTGKDGEPTIIIKTGMSLDEL